MVPIDLAEPLEVGSHIHVISDTMDPLRHHGTGEIIDSKAKFRAATKACGAIELGNEVPRMVRQAIRLDKRQRREDIKRAIYELRNGRHG